MKKLGIVGQGFVGKAVYEIMKNHFDMHTFDINPTQGSTEKSINDLVNKVHTKFFFHSFSGFYLSKTTAINPCLGYHSL